MIARVVLACNRSWGYPMPGRVSKNRYPRQGNFQRAKVHSFSACIVSLESKVTDLASLVAGVS